MKVLRYPWIVLLALAPALAEEAPVEKKEAPAPSSAEGGEKKPGEGGKGKKQESRKGDRGKEARRAMMEMWKKADTDGDGFISLVEFSAMERPGRLPEEKRAEIFKRIDKNGDGKIDPEEMPKGHPGGGMPPLEQVDFNKDGRIVFEEFQKLGFVARLPEERQRGLFARMDRDGDGALTPKDRPERDGRGKGKGDRDGKGERRFNPLDMVKDHDKNGDGSLSFEEFRDMPWLKDKGEDEQEDRFEGFDKNKDLKIDATDFPPPGAGKKERDKEKDSAE